MPRHKALQLSVERLREVADAIYDVTVAYSDTRTNPRTEAPGLTGKILIIYFSRYCAELREILFIYDLGSL